MNILIIGCEGTIGKQLVNKLQSSHNIVFCADRQRDEIGETLLCDLHNYPTLEKVFSQAKPNIVINLAGEVSRVTCEDMPQVALESNIIGTQNVIELCLKYNSKLIFAGTSEEYGNCFNNGTYVTEDVVPTRHNGIYGLSKWQAEELIKYYHDRYNLNAIVVRLFMCYGPGEYPSPYRSAISRFINDALYNYPLHVHKDTERSWCYIDDIVDGIISCINYNTTNYEVINIGRNDPISSYGIAKLIIEYSNSKSEIIEEPCPNTIIPIKRGNFLKAKLLLNWSSVTSLEVGLKKTIAWNRNIK
jgi:nucleoside-diphosphate-sugar epimerase